MRWGLAVVLVTTVAATPAASADEKTALTDPTKLPLRVHVGHIGAYGLTPDASERDEERSYDTTFDDVPVVETRPGRVRIVHDEDSARMLMWIDEKDLAWGIAKKTRIAGKGDVGVWLMPGARVTATGRGARRKIVTRFTATQDVSLSGVVAADALTRTFAEAVEPTGRDGEAATFASQLSLEPGGRRIGGIPHGLPVVVVAPGRGDWKLVEHRSRWLEVRAWARDRHLSDGLGISLGTGGGTGYGMSHVKVFEVPVGTCLHAAEDGPIAGIQTAKIKRYSPEQHGNWYALYVGNAWGLFRVYARVTKVDGAGKPTFAPCP